MVVGFSIEPCMETVYPMSVVYLEPRVGLALVTLGLMHTKNVMRLYQLMNTVKYVFYCTVYVCLPISFEHPCT